MHRYVDIDSHLAGFCYKHKIHWAFVFFGFNRYAIDRIIIRCGEIMGLISNLTTIWPRMGSVVIVGYR